MGVSIGILVNRLQDSRNHLHLDVTPNRFIEKRSQALDNGVQISRTWLQFLATRERQQFSCKAGCSISLLSNTGKTLGDPRKCPALFLTQLGPSQNCAHHMVEIVSHASCELPGGLKLLGLQQLLLQASQFGHIFDDGLHLVPGSRHRQVSQVQLDGKQAAIFAPPFCLRCEPAHLTGTK
jgi:hypothetical protein